MGKHEPQNPPVDAHLHQATADYAAAYTAPDHTPPGPRRAAARARKKRTLLLASATGLTLVVAGGTATAIITSGVDPQEATATAVIPDAHPDPLVAPEQAGEIDPRLREQAQQAQNQATQSQSATAKAIQQEPEPEPEEEPATTDSSTDSGQSTGQSGTCQASFYGDGFHGATTANGETFDTYGMTAAHKTLPFNTMVKVTNPNNGKSVTVRINDRGPYIDGRCLDLSTAAFDQIIGTGAGVGTVDWEVVG